MNIEVPCVNTSEIKKTLKGMSSDKGVIADALSMQAIFYWTNSQYFFFPNACKSVIYQILGKML